MFISYSHFRDVTQRLIALVIFISVLPIFLSICVLLAISLRGNPIFKQKRPGLNCKPFMLMKFRTMTNETDPSGHLLPDHQRMTKVGKVIRKTSLDELPQLVNIILGDMGFIGPRPLLMEYLPLYTKEQLKRHNVLPGITGWAQVNGRNSLTWSEKFELDLYYVENQSLLLDIKIIIKTIRNVVTADGVNASEKVTMEPFNGSN